MAGAEDTTDSEDDEIKQALFLVNLLRSDYGKLMLREKIDPTENLSTCPLTTENSSSVVSHTTPVLLKNVTTKESNDSSTATSPSPIESSSSTAASPLPALTTKQIARRGPFIEVPAPEDMPHYPGDYPSFERFKERRKFRKFRRRMMPTEYYYYYDMPARPESFRVPRTYRPYRNINYRHANFRRMMPVNTDTNLTENVSSPRPSDPSSKASLTSGSVTPRPSSRSPPSRKVNTTSKKKATNFKSAVITENIFVPQVARELLNELKGGGLTMEQSTPTKRNLRTRTTKTGKSMKLSDFVKRYADELKQRTTLKIYLDHSTRLPWPLPENNAYCFMNPKSTLCRTNI